MGLRNEKRFSGNGVFRRGCGVPGSGSDASFPNGSGGYGGGGSQVMPVYSDSPVTVRMEFSQLISWTAGNPPVLALVIDDPAMTGTSQLIVDYTRAPVLASYSLDAGILWNAIADTSSGGDFATSMRRDTTVRNGVWNTANANYILSGRILWSIGFSLVDTLKCHWRIRYQDGTNDNTFGVFTDTSIDQTGTLTLAQLCQPFYTTYSVNVSFVDLGWSYTVTPSIETAIMFRRPPNANDDIWVATSPA